MSKEEMQRPEVVECAYDVICYALKHWGDGRGMNDGLVTVALQRAWFMAVLSIMDNDPSFAPIPREVLCEYLGVRSSFDFPEQYDRLKRIQS